MCTYGTKREVFSGFLFNRTNRSVHFSLNFKSHSKEMTQFFNDYFIPVPGRKK